MTTRAAIEHYKDVMALSKALKISRTAIYKWGKYPPLLRQYEIEKLTDGKLRVGKRND